MLMKSLLSLIPHSALSLSMFSGYNFVNNVVYGVEFAISNHLLLEHWSLVQLEEIKTKNMCSD